MVGMPHEENFAASRTSLIYTPQISVNYLRTVAGLTFLLPKEESS